MPMTVVDTLVRYNNCTALSKVKKEKKQRVEEQIDKSMRAEAKVD